MPFRLPGNEHENPGDRPGSDDGEQHRRPAVFCYPPIDLIPDFIPVLGYLDDVILLPLGILLVIWLIPPSIMAEHRELAAAAQVRPVSRIAVVVIDCIWVSSIGLCGWLVYRYFAR